jgi:hypothetical protein
MKKAIGTLEICISELDIRRGRLTVLSCMPAGGKTHEMRPSFTGTPDFLNPACAAERVETGTVVCPCLLVLPADGLHKGTVALREGGQPLRLISRLWRHVPIFSHLARGNFENVNPHQLRRQICKFAKTGHQFGNELSSIDDVASCPDEAVDE